MNMTYFCLKCGEEVLADENASHSQVSNCEECGWIGTIGDLLTDPMGDDDDEGSEQDDE